MNNIYQIQLDLLDIKFFWRALILGTEMEDYPNYNLNVNAISISWYLESSLIKLGLMIVENPLNPQILHYCVEKNQGKVHSKIVTHPDDLLFIFEFLWWSSKS